MSYKFYNTLIISNLQTIKAALYLHPTTYKGFRKQKMSDS